MEQQTLKGRIAACERAYQACFCTGEETPDGIRWRDDALPDMYDHHFLRLNKGLGEEAMEQAIRREVALRKAQGAHFCKVTLPDDWAGTLSVAQDAEIASLGCYAMPAEKLAALPHRQDCRVERVTRPEQLEILLALDLLGNKATSGEDFCRRRVERRGKVYLAQGGVDCYLCFLGEERVGSCDLLVQGSVAKGEDFTIRSDRQKQGLGSAVLAHLAGIARERGAETFYVMTDEDDTAWQMYRKCGMDRVGGRQEWFFAW